MYAFSFENTTRIHFGENQIAQIANEIPKGKKVLLVYGGGSIKKNGVYDEVTKALTGFSFGEFSGIEANPQYDTLMKAVEKIKAEKFDYILAVGGGSVVDGCKLIAAAAELGDKDPWDEILVKQEPIKKALPLGCVLTLPATGSETNANAVVSRGDNKLYFGSPIVRPTFAILDPKVTISLSPRQTANGVVDAFVHVMEQYLTYPVNAKVQDRFAEGIVQTLIEEGPKVLKNPNDLEARANVMFAAMMALNGLIACGVPQDWVTHNIGHEITGLYGVDHARTLSIILPAVMKVCAAEKEQKILQLGERVFGIKDHKVSSVINAVVKFFQSMEVPVSFKDAELTEEAVAKVMQKLKDHNRNNMGENGTIDHARCELILKEALAA